MGFWGVTLGFYSQCIDEHVRDVQPSFRSTLDMQNVPNLLEIFSSIGLQTPPSFTLERKTTLMAPWCLQVMMHPEYSLTEGCTMMA